MKAGLVCLSILALVWGMASVAEMETSSEPMTDLERRLERISRPVRFEHGGFDSLRTLEVVNTTNDGACLKPHREACSVSVPPGSHTWSKIDCRRVWLDVTNMYAPNLAGFEREILKRRGSTWADTGFDAPMIQRSLQPAFRDLPNCP